MTFPDGTVGFSTDGTPVDCVRLARLGLIEDFEAELVVSGINHGSNLGDDITYSGTVAAALEAIILGLPGIAVSQQSPSLEQDFRHGPGFNFDAAAKFTARLVAELEDVPLPSGTLLNINVPGTEPTGVEVGGWASASTVTSWRWSTGAPMAGGCTGSTATPASSGTRPDTDLAAVARGKIALTPIHFDLTDREGLDALQQHDLARLIAPAASEVRGMSAAREHGQSLRSNPARRRAAQATRLPRLPLLRPRRSRDRRRSYDALIDELRAIETEHPELVTPDSPTQRIGGEPVSDLEKVRHPQPMLSLANARSADELRAWIARMRNHLAREGIEDPRLRVCGRAEDRWSGDLADLPRRHVRARRDARQRRDRRGRHPQPADDPSRSRSSSRSPNRRRWSRSAARSYMSLPDFAKLNERRAEAGLSTFMNPRNSAAGTIRQLDPKLAADRPLSFWAYAIGATEGISFDAHWDALAWLREHRFPVHPDVEKLTDRGRGRGSRNAASGSSVAARSTSRSTASWSRSTTVELQRRLGVVGREPRWAIAWKFPPTTAVTKLNEIGWNPGKFGDLHPFAMLEPVHVGGVTIKQATLHNEEDLARKDIRIGEDVIVLRAGDVIPQVLSPAPHVAERKDRPPAPQPPGRCPVCDTPTVKPEGSVFTRCPNRDCPGRRWQLLTHFVGAMDIDGLGEKQVTLFMDLGWVRTAADFYRLTAEQIAEQNGFGQVSAEKLVRRDRGLQAAAVRPRAVCGRDRGGGLRDRPQPRRPLPHDRCAAGGESRGDRADTGRRTEDGGR